MDKRDRIRELIASINSLSYDDDHSLDVYLARAQSTVRELFGEFNAYLTCLSYIRFHPISPVSSVEENVRFWARAKKEMRDFLYVMLDDPVLTPRESQPVRVLATAGDETGEWEETAATPRFEINSTLSEVVHAFKHKVRVDLAVAQQVQKEQMAQLTTQVVSFRPETSGKEGPRTMEKIRIDLRDLFILEPREGRSAPRYSSFSTARMGEKGILFFPSTNSVRNSDLLAQLKRMGLPIIEAEPLTPAGASVQEQLLRYPKIVAAVVVLNDDHMVCPRQQIEVAPSYGPAPSVSFSLGFLVGKLGRKHVAVFYPDEENFKRPTSYFDAVYIAHDQAGTWKKELALYFRELWFSLDDVPLSQPVSS